MPPGGSKGRKSYLQFCPIARALDLVGDRWTVLILRELLGGPARFNELQAGLPGIAKNLLTARLRQLEDDGVLKRAPVHGATHYVLTDEGASIRPILENLAFWGKQFARVAAPKHERSPRAVAVAVQAILGYTLEHLPEERTVVEVETDEGHFEFVLGPKPKVTVQPGLDADVRLKAPASALHDYLHGRGLDRRAFAYVSGDRGARTALLDALAARA